MTTTHINCPSSPYEAATVAAEDLVVGEELGLEVVVEVAAPVTVGAVPAPAAELVAET
jgi:hypothetical protein